MLTFNECEKKTEFEMDNNSNENKRLSPICINLVLSTNKNSKTTVCIHFSKWIQTVIFKNSCVDIKKLKKLQFISILKSGYKL